jgi:acyl carrier protein
MTVEYNDDHLLSVVTKALQASNKTDTLSAPVTMASRMGSPKEWDSLSFVSVFLAVGEAYDVELDDDDAIHFQTMSGIHSLMLEILEE